MSRRSSAASQQESGFTSATERRGSILLNNFDINSIEQPQPADSRAIRKTSVNELEYCMKNFYSIQDLPLLFEKYPDVKEAIGRLSFAIYYEKSDDAQIEAIEEAFSKASAAISNALEKGALKDEDEGKYWFKLMDLHTNSHLREIVALAEGHSMRAPYYYEKIEQENQNLKNDMDELKAYLEDMKIELEFYRTKASEQEGNEEQKVTTINGTTSVHKHHYYDEYGGSMSELLPWNQLDQKLQRAKGIIKDLKGIDSTIHRHLEDQSTFMKNFLTRLDNVLWNGNPPPKSTYNLSPRSTPPTTPRLSGSPPVITLVKTKNPAT